MPAKTSTVGPNAPRTKRGTFIKPWPSGLTRPNGWHYMRPLVSSSCSVLLDVTNLLYFRCNARNAGRQRIQSADGTRRRPERPRLLVPPPLRMLCVCLELHIPTVLAQLNFQRLSFFRVCLSRFNRRLDMYLFFGQCTPNALFPSSCGRWSTWLQ